MCKAKIFNIQRFCTSDGPGIRTTVFFKGCPLDCAWCHNPESKRMTQEIFFKPESCVFCNACAVTCKNGCHSITADGHALDRTQCAQCGTCATVCPTGALEACGEEKTPQEILQTVLRDKPFYETSGGGLTLSGGEPLLQFDLVLSLLKLAKAAGIHTAVETCGYTPRDLAEIHPYTDLWLFDIKLLDPADHLRYTGVSNERILQNLHILDNLQANIILRCPIIPDINLTDAHFTALADLAGSLKNVSAIHLEPYHPLGLSKAQQLGKTQAFAEGAFLNPETLTDYVAVLQEKTGVPVAVQ